MSKKRTYTREVIHTDKMRILRSMDIDAILDKELGIQSKKIKKVFDPMGNFVRKVKK